MDIRRVLRGENVSFSAARPARSKEGGTAGTARPSADRVELSRQWVENMEEQRARAEAALLTGAKEEKKSDGILDMLDSPENEELDAMSQEMKTKMKCLEIAMRIMKGKRVPPEDERYLMENDPEGYKLAMAMKAMVKEDDEECESVLDDEDENGGKTESSDSGESAPTESSGGGEAAPSGDGGSVE